MKKTIIAIALLFGALSLQAVDSYIYWLQDSADFTDKEGVTAPFENKDYTAKVVAINGSEWSYLGGDYLDLWRAGEGGTPGASIGDSTILNLSSAGDNPYRYINITSQIGTSTMTYFVELYNDGELFARSLGLSGTEVGAYVYTSDMGMGVPARSYSVPEFIAAAAPEPTSGLLLLVGSALLALRRKRRV